MKGLILHNFYAGLGSLKWNLVIIVILGIASIFWQTGIIPSIFFAQLIMVPSISIAGAIQKEASWSKMEVIMPVKRSNIIRAKYVSSILQTIGGVVIALLYVLFVYRNAEFDQLNSLFLIMVITGMGLGTTATFYPLSLFFGGNKNEIFTWISILPAVGILALLTFLLDNRFLDNPMESNYVAILYLVISLVLFVLSYFISIRIYDRKEF